jgi:adenylate cyclase
MGAALGEHDVLRHNVVASVAYSCIVIPIAVAWAVVWTTIPSDRDERVARHRVVMAIPARLTSINGLVWTCAAVMLVALNYESPWLAVTLGVSTLLAGSVTAALTYWFCARALRALAAEELTRNPPTTLRGPSLRTRAVTSWGVGTGVPLLMVLLVAASALVVDYSAHRLSIAVLAIGGGAVVSGLVVATFTGATTADPIEEVREGMQRVGRGEYDVSIPVFDASELGLLQAGFNAMAGGLRERERLRDLFGRHVGHDVARLAEQSASIDGEQIGRSNAECEVGVLFVDLVGSTQLAATVSPERLVEILNGFFEAVVDVVELHGGLINKFEGDAALAIFGAPLPTTDCAGRALAAGRDLHERLQLSKNNIEAGIGISAGVVVAGYIGHPARYEYTVIGDPVNEAARLADVAKTSGGLAASGAALDRSGEGEAHRWRVVRSEVLRGRGRPTMVAVPTGT